MRGGRGGFSLLELLSFPLPIFSLLGGNGAEEKEFSFLVFQT